MTLEFAKIEAQRRTVELGTVHYVVPYRTSDRAVARWDEGYAYMVLTDVPRGYLSVAHYLPVKFCPLCGEYAHGPSKRC